MPPTCQLYVLRWPPDVSTVGACTVRSSKQIWTGLQWCPPDVTSRGRGSTCPMSGERWGCGVPYTVRSNASWVMVTTGPPNRMTDTCENITFPQLHHWLVVKTAAALWTPSLLPWYPIAAATALKLHQIVALQCERVLTLEHEMRYGTG